METALGHTRNVSARCQGTGDLAVRCYRHHGRDLRRHHLSYTTPSGLLGTVVPQRFQQRDAPRLSPSEPRNLERQLRALLFNKGHRSWLCREPDSFVGRTSGRVQWQICAGRPHSYMLIAMASSCQVCCYHDCISTAQSALIPWVSIRITFIA